MAVTLSTDRLHETGRQGRDGPGQSVRMAGLALAFSALILPRAGTAAPNEFFWQPLSTLGQGDRAYAETALYDFWGADPSLWPDWLDPAVVRVPAGPGRNILIVRQPLRQPCGEYGFTVLGPVTPQGDRRRYGPRFCGGDLQVAPPGWGRSMPDIVVGESREQDAEGTWQEKPPTRWRWTNEGWRTLK